jgi:hypothetical protein
MWIEVKKARTLVTPSCGRNALKAKAFPTSNHAPPPAGLPVGQEQAEILYPGAADKSTSSGFLIKEAMIPYHAHLAHHVAAAGLVRRRRERPATAAIRSNRKS